MTEIKHTPGPWAFEPNCGKGAWVAGSNGQWAALSCGSDNENAIANARLIAAAPELLDSVWEFLDKYDEMSSAELFQKLPGEEAQRVVRARKVIAKATGAA